jgi:5-(carboxyamino)imidazole ribonucleotide synthase
VSAIPTLGILGDGQLGRMLAQAAAQLGVRCHAFGPEADGPAAQVCWRHSCARFDDTDALDAFAAAVDVVTIEWENVPVAAAERVAARVPLHPGPGVLATAQDRLSEKRMAQALGIGTAPFVAVDTADDLARALAQIGPGILKTRRLGYDGKGQVRLGADADPGAAFAAIGAAPAILEGLVPFQAEVSVLACRGQDGSAMFYGPIENQHRDGILRVSSFPAVLPPAVIREALDIAGTIATHLDAVGVIGVELFVVGERVLFNEVAPRVHNSGHGTIEGCVTSQFENHVRAVLGWPLGASDPLGITRMENLIGDDLDRLPALRADPTAHLHLYGKAERRPGRKMGHVTWVG